MAVKVLVVDDSGFFRRRVSEILSADPSIQVVGTATNGKEAIDQAIALFDGQRNWVCCRLCRIDRGQTRSHRANNPSAGLVSLAKMVT